jgi:hypothetical protein
MPRRKKSGFLISPVICGFNGHFCGSRISFTTKSHSSRRRQRPWFLSPPPDESGPWNVTKAYCEVRTGRSCYRARLLGRSWSANFVYRPTNDHADFFGSSRDAAPVVLPILLEEAGKSENRGPDDIALDNFLFGPSSRTTSFLTTPPIPILLLSGEISACSDRHERTKSSLHNRYARSD